jgi:hypothetical protein
VVSLVLEGHFHSLQAFGLSGISNSRVKRVLSRNREFKDCVFVRVNLFLDRYSCVTVEG